MNLSQAQARYDAASPARTLDSQDRADDYGWMRCGQFTSDAEWTRDTIGLIAERHWIAIAEAMAAGDECEAGKRMQHALQRHAIDDVRKLDGIDLRNAEYLAEGSEP